MTGRPGLAGGIAQGAVALGRTALPIRSRCIPLRIRPEDCRLLGSRLCACGSCKCAGLLAGPCRGRGAGLCGPCGRCARIGGSGLSACWPLAIGGCAAWRLGSLRACLRCAGLCLRSGSGRHHGCVGGAGIGPCAALRVLLHGRPALRGPRRCFALVGLMQRVSVQTAKAAQQDYAQSQPDKAGAVRLCLHRRIGGRGNGDEGFGRGAGSRGGLGFRCRVGVKRLVGGVQPCIRVCPGAHVPILRRGGFIVAAVVIVIIVVVIAAVVGTL